ncbi:MAG: hypothetical protein AABO58_24890 [Acidobacteriota bacterium]
MRAFVLLALITSTAIAADFEQVLVPFDTMTVPGVGTVWSAELHVRNDGDTPVNLFPDKCVYIGLVFPCAVLIDVPARATVLLDLFDDRFANVPNGLFVYVPTTRIDDVSFSLRIRASSSPIGTEIPVVRLRNYRTGRTTLLDVPLGTDSRAALRVYSADPQMHTFIVRVFREPGGELILQESFFFSHPTDPTYPTAGPLMFDVSSALSNASLQKPGRVRVTIEAPDQRYWPLLTMTDNAMHHVTAITPQ